MKPHFRWDEPRAILATDAVKNDVATPWYLRPLVFLFLTCMLLNLPNKNSAKPSYSFQHVIIIIAVSFLISHIEYLMGLFIPNHVSLLEKQIWLIRAGNSQIFNYKEIASVEISDSADYRALTLILQNGRRVVMGVPLDVDVTQIENFFAERCGRVDLTGRPD